MLKLLDYLKLDRCSHCGIAKPTLNKRWGCDTQSHSGDNRRIWATYQCSTCGGVILACSPGNSRGNVSQFYPTATIINEDIPSRPKEFLSQAIESMNAPAGAVMLTASAVDAMLKEKEYKEGGLYSRIDQAAADHLITSEMAAWAHEIRLDANDQRHADDSIPLPHWSLHMSASLRWSGVRRDELSYLLKLFERVVFEHI